MLKSTSRAAAIAAFAGLALAATAANAQLVVGNDQSANSTLWLMDLTNVNPPRALVTGTGAGQCWTFAADEVNDRLFWTNGSTLYTAPYTLSGTLTPTNLGVVVLGAGLSGAATGLAYDTATGKLHARHSSGFSEIDFSVSPPTATLVHAISAQDFGGFDYDPATDAYYGTNDSTSTTVLPNGRGLYRIDKPWSSPTFTHLAAYPTADVDIDGCAVGGGRVYLINDAGTQQHFVYNLTTNTYETALTNPMTAAGTFSGGAWAPGLLTPAAGSDISVAIADSPDPLLVPPGGNLTYTVTVTNNGPDAATGVAFTNGLPGNVTFQSVQAPGVFNSGVVTANIGNMAVNDSVAFNITVTANGLGSITNIGSVTSSSPDGNNSNNSATATTTVRPPQADLRARITAPADCTVALGGTASYTFSLDNLGQESGDNCSLVVTLPGNVTFQNSSPPVTPVGNTLTLDLGMVPFNSGGSLIVNVTVDSGTSVLMQAAVSGTTSDPTPGNNSTSDSLEVPANAPTTASITALLSTIATSANSDIPSSGGFKFATGGLERPFRSPDGTRWIMAADSDNPTTTQDQFLIAGTIGGSFLPVAQEGATQLVEADFIGTFDPVTGINDSGHFIFSTNTDGPTNSDEVVVKHNGTSFITVARESTDCPAVGGALWGTTSSSGTIQNDGTTSFYSSLLNTGGTTNDTGVFTDDGGTILGQESGAGPTGQSGGLSDTWKSFDTGATDGQGFFVDASGNNSVILGAINNASTTLDRVLVVNNDVKGQENVVLPGTTFGFSTDDTSPFNYAMMESDGSWLAYGDNNDDQDWVLRNGAVVAVTDEPITPGNSELYDDAPYAQTFYFAVGGPTGDYVVGGTTNASTALSNAVLVLNGSTVIARENDPVDLDGNGIFDDGYYIRTFIDDYAFLTTDAFYCVVRLRDAASALCATTDTDRGQALIRIPIGPTGCIVTCDFNQDGGGDTSDVIDLADSIASGTDPFPASCKDFNQDGGADTSDVIDLADAIASGTCP